MHVKDKVKAHLVEAAVPQRRYRLPLALGERRHEVDDPVRFSQDRPTSRDVRLCQVRLLGLYIQGHRDGRRTIECGLQLCLLGREGERVKKCV